MPKGKKKLNQKHRRRHGVFAAPGAPKREGNGRVARDRSVEGREARIDPTPETVAKLRNEPTDPIDKAIARKLITQDQAAALMRYRSDRHAKLELRDVMDKPGPIARIMIRDATDAKELPSGWRMPRTDEDRERMAERYSEAYDAIKATRDRRATGQAALVIAGYMWTDGDSLSTAAEALRAFYIAGQKTRLTA